LEQIIKGLQLHHKGFNLAARALKDPFHKFPKDQLAKFVRTTLNTPTKSSMTKNELIVILRGAKDKGVVEGLLSTPVAPSPWKTT
jgi:hypothetical protein